MSLRTAVRAVFRRRFTAGEAGISLGGRPAFGERGGCGPFLAIMTSCE